MGPIHEMSITLRISIEDACSYCEAIRKLSGLGSRLQYRTIALLLRQNLSDSSPESVAEIIKNEHLIAQQETRSSLSKKIKRTPKGVYVSRAVNMGEIYDPTKKPPPPSGVVHTSHLDQERVTEDKLKHCPHGVPLIRLCAICEPKKFSEMTGID